MSWRRLAPPLLLALAIGTTARAGDVTIEWGSAAGASSYELQVLRGKQIVTNRTITGSSTSWSGNLPFGIYQYQLRTVDNRGRKSAWSAPTRFLVTPEPPQLVLPAPDSTVLPQANAVSFQWSPVAGVRKYLLEVRAGSQTYRKVATAAQMTMNDLRPGSYSWTVKPIIDTEARAGEGVQSQVLETKASESWSFKLDTGAGDRVPTSIESLTGLVDVSAGVLVSTDYFFPQLHPRLRLGRDFALGVRGLYSGDSAGGIDLTAFGWMGTFAWFPFHRALSGPFVEAAVGAYLFSAKSATAGSESATSPALSAFAGYEWFPTGTGFHLTVAVGLQYVRTPSLSIITSKVRGALPAATVTAGFAF